MYRFKTLSKGVVCSLPLPLQFSNSLKECPPARGHPENMSSYHMGLLLSIGTAALEAVGCPQDQCLFLNFCFLDSPAIRNANRGDSRESIRRKNPIFRRPPDLLYDFWGGVFGLLPVVFLYKRPKTPLKKSYRSGGRLVFILFE